MRNLRLRGDHLALVAGLIALCFNNPPIRAAEISDQAPASAAEVDLAKVQSGGRVVFVSSGARLTGFTAIDDDRRTTFPFSSSDSRPTVIVELTENRPIHRVSVVLGSEGGKADVYLLDKLPRATVDLDQVAPVASLVDGGIGRESSVEFAPKSAHYVALRWTMTGAHASALKIAEIGAFTRDDFRLVDPSLAATDPPIYLVQGPPAVPIVSP